MGFAVLVAASVGILLGASAGYLAWGVQQTALARDLAQTQSWLMEEVRRTEALRQARELEAREAEADADAVAEADADAVAEAEASAERQRAQLAKMAADLEKAEAELKRWRAMAREAAQDWRAELQRRRELQARLARQTECR